MFQVINFNFQVFIRYSNIECPWDDRSVIEGLISNEEIILLKQDKGLGVVLLNKSEYVSKLMEFLESEQFVKLQSDPTKSFQTKVQNKLRTMKKASDRKTYKKLYPSHSPVFVLH